MNGLSVSLMELAAKEQGLKDFGELDFVESLDKLLESVQAEANLSDAGWAGFVAGIINHLKNRLRFQEDLKSHPAILSEDVSDPIIITGLSRTGTTKLQRIMAVDSNTQKLLLWQCMNPAPLADRVSEGEYIDPRIAIAKGSVDAFKQVSPDFIKAHSMGAELPEEDSMLFQATFQSSTEGYFYNIPSFIDWLAENRPLTNAYGYFKNLVQYLQWQGGGKQGRPWVLKGTPHLGLLDEVLEVFPNATIVQCHRDPKVAIPSLCRLNEAGRISRGCNDLDFEAMGRFFTNFGADMWERQLNQLAKVEGRANIVDVYYDDIRDDAINVVRRIYRSRSMDLSKGAEQAMQSWEQHNPQHVDGKHRYDLERYGLTKAEINKAFEKYLNRFPRAVA